MPADLQPCGTHAAYARHIRAGEPACQKCLTANNAEFADDRRVYSRARSRAMRLLQGEHRDRFRELYTAEKAAAPGEPYTRLYQRALRKLTREFRDEYAGLLETERALQATEAADE